MKKLVNVFGWYVIFHLLNSIIYYIYFCFKFKVLGKIDFKLLYSWFIVKGEDYDGNKYIKIEFWMPESVIISTAIFLAVLVFVYRKKIISFLKMTFAKLKQNTKSARIARLEQELEELKKNK